MRVGVALIYPHRDPGCPSALRAMCFIGKCPGPTTIICRGVAVRKARQRRAVEAPMRFSGRGAIDAGRGKRTSAACAGIFHSYQQLLRIATQPTTQHLHRIDIQGIFVPKHSLRDGFTAYFALSSETRLCCLRRSQIIACELDTNLGVPGPRDFADASARSSRAPPASIASRFQHS